MKQNDNLTKRNDKADFSLQNKMIVEFADFFAKPLPKYSTEKCTLAINITL